MQTSQKHSARQINEKIVMQWQIANDTLQAKKSILQLPWGRWRGRDQNCIIHIDDFSFILHHRERIPLLLYLGMWFGFLKLSIIIKLLMKYHNYCSLIIYKMMPVLEQDSKKYNHVGKIRCFSYYSITVNS